MDFESYVSAYSLGPREFLVIGLVGGSVLVLASALLGVFRRSVGALLLPSRTLEQHRANLLASLGYVHQHGTRWARSIRGMRLVFVDGDRDWVWTIQLPRYNTMTFKMDEREGKGMGAFGRGTFLSQNEALDKRFVIASDRPIDALALLGIPGVPEGLLSMPWVSLRITGDELTLTDPDLTNLRKLARGDPAEPAVRLAAETEVHQQVERLVSRLLNAMDMATPTPVLGEQ